MASVGARGAMAAQEEEARRRRSARERPWDQPMFGGWGAGRQVFKPSLFKPLPSLGMGPVKELKYDSPFKQNFSVGSSDLGIQPLSPKTLAIGSNEGMSLANLPSSESMFSGYKGELSLPSLTGMAEKMGVGGSSAPEFDPAILGGIGSAVGIGAGLIGSAISAKKASDSAALSQSPGEWHARRTDPMLHEIDRQAFAPVNAARRGAVMEGGRALAANIAGGSGWLGERAGESLSGSFGRAAGHAQQQAALRKAKVRDENEEERMRRVAAQQAKPAQFGKAASGMVGLIPGPVGKIGQLATGLGSKLFSSAIT